MKKTSWFFRTLSCAIAVVSSSALLVFTPAPVPVSTVLGDAGIGMMSVEAAEVYFKKPSKRYSSIVDALKSIGVDSSYAYREKIAAANGISGYKGTSAQNTRLLDLLYAGKLKKPGSGGGSGNTNQASSMSKIALSVPTYRQYDNAWKNVKIGDKTIGAVGCTTCCIAMVYSYHNGTRITPDKMKKKLSYDGNNVYWSSVTKLGYTVTAPYNCSINSSILKKIYDQLKKGRPVIVGGKSGSGQHWIVVCGFSGGSLDASNFRIIDPNNAGRTTLSQFLNYKPTVYRLVY